MIAVASADHVEAERLFEQSLQHCQHNRDLRGAAWAANGLGDVYRKTGRLEEAVSWYSQAMGWFEEIGNTYGAMWCTHDIAQAQRAAGDLEAAERGYLAMIALAERIGQRVVAPRLNLGLVRVLRGDFDQARIPFEEVAEESHLRASSGEEGIAHICLLPCDAAAGDWAAVEAGLDLARRQIGQLIDADLAAMTRIAADYAATPRPTLAAELRDFANLIGG